MAEKPIVVFRFDRDPFVCQSAISRLRKLNPGIDIHGLYGAGPGYRQHAMRLGAQHILGLDSFYALRHDGQWNWKNGDLALLEWYQDFGWRLGFDVVYLLEWDLLLLDPVADVYSSVPRGAVALTCLTPVSELVGRWRWLQEPDALREWELLSAYARSHWGHVSNPLACWGVGPRFPRGFLEAYAALAPPELCHDELRLPLAVQTLGFPLVDTGLRRRWADAEEDRYFSAGGPAVDPGAICAESRRPGGQRVFHPVRQRAQLPRSGE